MTPERSRIDWEKVRARLAKSRRALESAAVSPERLAEVYRERAAVLAARGRSAAGSADGLRVLAFVVGRESFGLDFRDVGGILPFAGCTPVPGGPPELLGVVNVRGDLRSVVDLGRLIGVPPAGDATGYVLLVRTAAFRVDRVEAIRPAELGADATASAFVRGVTPDRLRVLDTAALLAHPVFRGGPTGSPGPEKGSP